MWTRGSTQTARCLAACTTRAHVLPQRCTLQVLPWTRTPQRMAGALPSRVSQCDWAGGRRWFATEGDNDDTDGAEDGENPIVKRKKKLDENFYGIVHIQATFNNTIVNITDVTGATLCWSSGGEAEGYRGSRKKSPFAGQLAAEKAAEKAMLKGVRSVRVRVKGVGRGRETALRALITSGLEVTAVEDVTPIPHNGCRPKKSRRL